MTGEHEHFDLNSGESLEKVNVCAFVACFFKIPVKGQINHRHMLLLVAMYLSPERLAKFSSITVEKQRFILDTLYANTIPGIALKRIKESISFLWRSHKI